MIRYMELFSSLCDPYFYAWYCGHHRSSWIIYNCLRLEDILSLSKCEASYSTLFILLWSTISSVRCEFSTSSWKLRVTIVRRDPFYSTIYSSSTDFVSHCYFMFIIVLHKLCTLNGKNDCESVDNTEHVHIEKHTVSHFNFSINYRIGEQLLKDMDSIPDMILCSSFSKSFVLAEAYLL